MSQTGRRYFGTDGVRGKVGVAPITPDFVLRLGYAAGKVLAARAAQSAASEAALSKPAEMESAGLAELARRRTPPDAAGGATRATAGTDITGAMAATLTAASTATLSATSTATSFATLPAASPITSTATSTATLSATPPTAIPEPSSEPSSGPRPAVLIGKDTRVSGYMLEAALEAGLSAAGIDVMLAGPMPTPGVAYLTRALRLTAGVVISASHNPYYDNGIKFFSADGNKLPDDVETLIEAQLGAPLECAASEQLGKARRLQDAGGRYIEFCKSTFPQAFNLRGLKLVIDCANGAAYDIAPHVFHELGADVIPIGVLPNGFNINDGVGATAPDALARAVRANHVDLGIALDGDADRLQVVDANGRLFNGDELLYVLVKDRIATHGKVDGAVGTLMTNIAIEQALARLGVPFVRAQVGDRYVLEQLRERGWQLGAEGSGHILSLDRHTTGDGIVSALLVLAAMKRSGATLAQLLDGVTLFPQQLINVRIAQRANWKDNAAIQQAVRTAESALKTAGDTGRVLIRASGTEPLLRVMVEARDQRDAHHHAQAIAEVVKRAVG